MKIVGVLTSVRVKPGERAYAIATVERLSVFIFDAGLADIAAGLLYREVEMFVEVRYTPGDYRPRLRALSVRPVS